MGLTPELFAYGLLAVFVAGGVIAIWPSMGFVLLLSIPIVKTYLRSVAPGLMQGFTYDMAILFVSLIGVLIHRLRSGSMKWPLPNGFMLLWLVICILMWIRLPSSHSFYYGYKKSLWFSVFNTFACLLCPLFVVSFKDARRVLMAALSVGAVAALSVLFFGQAEHRFAGARTTVLGSNPLGVSMACVHLILIAFCFWLIQRRAWQLLLVVVGIPLAIYSIIKTGTRAGLFFPPVAILVALWMYRARINLRAVAAGILVSSVIAIILVVVIQPKMLTRFGKKQVGEGFRDRVALVRVTLNGFIRHPVLGNGTGDTAYQLGGAGYESYPHNHVLEIANELGIFGLAAYLGLLAYGFQAGWHLSRSALDGTDAKIVGVAAFACFLIHLIETWKSGTYAHMPLMYFFLTLTIVIDRLSAMQGTSQWLEHTAASTDNIENNPYLVPIQTT